MTVKDVNVPPRTKEEDIVGLKRVNESDTEYWQRVKESKRARREALEEEKALDSIENPKAPESPFKVEGSINLGKFDLQEESRKAHELAETTRTEAADRERVLAEKLEATQKDLADTKMTAVMEKMSNQFLAVIKEMNTKIDGVAAGADPSSVSGYLDTLETLAKKMGYQRELGGPAVGDPNLAIELQRMKAEEADRERKWQLELKKFDYEMQRQGRKDDAEISFRTAEEARQKKKDEMFASAPEVLGRAIARGMMEEGNGGGTSASINQKAKANGYQVTAAKGEVGEVDCPQCKGPIMIGPTAKKAVCAGCNLSVSVTRTESKPAESEPDPEPSDEEIAAGRERR